MVEGKVSGSFEACFFLVANTLERRSPRHSYIEIEQKYKECVMSSASEQLQSKLSNQEIEKKRNRIFLSEIAGPLITWTAIAATYASLQSQAPNTAAWGAIMFALFGLQAGLATWKARN